ncbi:MAG TPA: hypothetical protein DEP25_01325 [Candidatus Taylorbacteria bacterium]|nr:hypothetical protein [Candidatus Taylorbacteria bacterium]
MTSFTFGDIFQYDDKEYIFLAETEDILYAARILNKEHTAILKKGTTAAIRRNSLMLDNLTYSFVILQTQELRERAAYFATTGKNRFDNLIFIPLNIELCEEDLKGIKDEITKKKCVSIKLKELVRDIDI